LIPAFIVGQFAREIRKRGTDYFVSGRVRSLIADGSDHVIAEVVGSDSYLVNLDASNAVLRGTCSCPYAADNGACKHLWAVICAGDRNGMLAQLLRTTGPSASFVALTLDDTEFDDDPAEEAEFDEDELDPDGGWHSDGMPGPSSSHSRGSTPERPAWERLIDDARREMREAPSQRAVNASPWHVDRRIVYIIDVAAAWRIAGIPVELATEQRDGNGGWKEPAPFRLDPETWLRAPEQSDRHIAQMLIGAPESRQYGPVPRVSRFVLAGTAVTTTLRLICETQRGRIRDPDSSVPLVTPQWDDGPPWCLRLRIERSVQGYSLRGLLSRGDQEIDLAVPEMLHSEGVLLMGNSFAEYEHSGCFPFVATLRDTPLVPVSEAELPVLLESLFALPSMPALDLPDGTRVAESSMPPVPVLVMSTEARAWSAPQNFADLCFLYGTTRVRHGEVPLSVFERHSLTIRHRDREFENAALERLMALGARPRWNYTARTAQLGIARAKVLPILTELAMSGWRVESDGAVFRTSVSSRATVRSGIDWFELDARVSFGDGTEATLHELLEAKSRNNTTVLLADGSRGLIPLDWLARLGPLLSGGTVTDGALRFARSQAALLDALLSAVPEATVDSTFERARRQLRKFSRIEARNPPRTFVGTLRDYQRDGLGWLCFLRDFGLGGCLADDMGLGKTVQVLALLDSRRGTKRKPRAPSIVVAPRSLIFNWLREAERFTPRLRVLNHTGITRDLESVSAGVDVVLTTYGTLRRDASALSSMEFDYAVLDEAQAIKTAGSASAKAARLLRAENRLVMTGTPIENRLEELWSLFEFLNPGMLGSASAFSKLARLGGSSDGHQPRRDVLARALRPVILRRTKQQVARDLPPRTEQTLTVELQGAQRKFYDDLLGASRRSVLEKVDRMGIARSRIHVLEALLRLRQAACHPGLINRNKQGLPSAKLEALLPAVEEVVAEGHKALVFSQFTAFLALVRQLFDTSGLTYEYLDGKTRDRHGCVDRFQTDPRCQLFLISLKAGGQGLNLTAAEYVFILDPWWNPAVEAQAIDRAHRIGQKQRVIATRIVANNTIETKILELQERKRALADAILGQDQGLLSGIGRDELEMLLGE
jgi:superfamily II DNA or RNA helicase